MNKKVKIFLMTAMVVSVSLSRFFWLGDMEVQPWDEAMYASRAKSVVMHGSWLDQTEHSVNGLYSSSHPPLYIWLSALVMKFSGFTPFAARFWSAVAGAISVLMFFSIIDNKLAGFFSAMILGTNAFYFSYSRQGQLDVFCAFWICAGLLTFIRYDKGKGFLYLLLAGICFGFSLMSKILVGMFLPATVFIFLLVQVLSRRKTIGAAFREMSILSAIGALIALPWHLYMIVLYGHAFLDNFIVFHLVKRTLEGVESNIQRLGVLFYVNQLAVMMPVSLAVLVSRFFKIIRDKRSEVVIFFILFAVTFTVFSLSKTQLRTYSINFIPAVSVLTGFYLSDLARNKEKFLFTALLSAVFLIWSAYPFLRSAFKSDPGGLLMPLFVLTALSFVFVYLNKKSKKVLASLCLFFLACLSGIFSETRLFYSSQIDRFAHKFYSEGFTSLVYVDDTVHLTNPQITYYFNSIDRTADTGRQFVRIYRKPLDSGLVTDLTGKTLIVVNSWHENPEVIKIESFLKKKLNPRMIGANEFYRIYESE
ncbi:glycosyltransferase family 39 protein [candidate division WOR-3 bacterium]|nr:glycosyltransferase family 39 protein [candidate division WOR-3 bacterium]